jgi:hypothetical protein
MERVYRHTHHFFRTHRGQDIKQLLRRFPHEAEQGVYRALFKEDLQKASNARGQPARLAALLSTYSLFLSGARSSLLTHPYALRSSHAARACACASCRLTARLPAGVPLRQL